MTTIAGQLREDASTVKGTVVAQNMRQAANYIERLELEIRELQAQIERLKERFDDDLREALERSESQ